MAEGLVESHGRVRVSTTLVFVAITVAGWVISGYVGYTTAMSATNSRIAVVEAKADEFKEQLHDIRGEISEIRADVKTLLRRQQ